MSRRYVYLFEEGDRSMRNLLGGKGANLSEMTRLGLPIPQGFTVTTEACNKYYDDGKKITRDLEAQIRVALRSLEEITGKKFGDNEEPLLVSVRSGARVSMPGMMDTILNLGLNDVSVEGFAAKTENPRFAYDSYRRFIQMFADVVKGVQKSKFERVLDTIKEDKNYKSDADLTADDLKAVVKAFKKLYREELGEEFPQEPEKQLMASIQAVFDSWNNERAIIYRRMNNISGSWGTAVNVQAMVFGNMGESSGTGVAFTRNPATGEKGIYGEYLLNAQGEDVVAGIRTPESITHLKDQMPEVYAEFLAITDKLEKHYKDMQDMEFTIQEGKLYFLQTRSGKRTAAAALKIAVDLVEEGLVTEEEAVLKVEPKQLAQLLHPVFNPKALAEAKVSGKGLPASPGAAAGKVYFTAQEAAKAKIRGERVILVRLETSPEDIEGMAAAQGILTVRGGMTSHAAVVARGMGTCCVSGCAQIRINEAGKYFTLGDRRINEGDYISLDGSTGNIYLEDIKTMDPEIGGNFSKFMKWADQARRLKVRANADNPRDLKHALEFGAEGVGLCRTEHMFFEEERIPKIRRMIVSKTIEERKEALEELLPYQKSDFKAMYEELKGLPITIRLLDPPLHEFLPHVDSEIEALADDMNISFEELKQTVESLKEVNPMLGHRGCRLAVTYPEIAEMQARAIVEAALEVKKERGYDIVPEIMIPLVGEIKELAYVKEIVIDAAEKAIREAGIKMKYLVGTMIEIPRAALLANEIAKEAEFFSFGTNDLTQMTYGFSRDDASTFLEDYYSKAIFESDPFERIDQKGVGQLVRMGVERGRQEKADLKIGICGEHGGEPSSVEFFHDAGLDYVSCSPFRVPIARLAAAHAQIKNPR